MNKNEKIISECLDFHKIQAYIIKPLEKMAGNYTVVFPIGAQDTHINALENMEKYLLEYFTSAKISINGNNIVILII